MLQTIDADNVQALGNLILFHLCLWQRDQAAQYADRLGDIVVNKPLEGMDLSKAIEGLGFWEDYQALWNIAARLISKPKDVQGGGDWYILGAAAANTGHLPEAERLFKRAMEFPGSPLWWAEESLKAIRSARRNKKTPAGPSLSGRFPYIHFAQAWPL